MCTLHDFLRSKVRFIHTSILALEKITRTPRVHLAIKIFTPVANYRKYLGIVNSEQHSADICKKMIADKQALTCIVPY